MFGDVHRKPITLSCNSRCMPILFGHSLPFLEMNGGTTGTERLGELGKGNIPVNCLTEIFRGDNVIGMD